VSDDNVTITFAIYFDSAPRRDIGYTLAASVDGSTIFPHVNIDSFSDDEFRHRLYSTSLSLKRGCGYRLTVEDNRKNGLEGPSFYAIYFGSEVEGGEEILKQDQFASPKHEVVFVAERPDTSSPTVSASPTVSPSPTHAPTSCDSQSLQVFDAEDNAKDQNPHFKTSLTAFPTTSSYCTPHRSYQHCTNERREDCQWQFLSASGRKGVCRVDPLSKCLRENNCVCETEDLKEAMATLGGGILFHVPVSVTSQDIGQYRNQVAGHHELYTPPSEQEQNKSKHPQDEDFYISRTDFTARKLIYDLKGVSPLLTAPFERTVAFNP
jgi:hypothetical protein